MMRLRTQLIGSFALCLLIPSLLTGVYARRSFTASVLERAKTDRLTTINYQAQRVEDTLQSDRRDFVFVSRAPAVQQFINAAPKDRDIAGLEAFLRQFMIDSHFRYFFLADGEGNLVFEFTTINNGSAENLPNLSSWLARTSAQPPGGVFISASESYVHNGQAGPFITYGMPLLDASNRRFGSLIAMSAIKDIVAVAASTTPSEITYVIDGATGQYLLAPDTQGERTLYDDAVNDAGLILAKNQKQGTLSGSSDRPTMLQTFVHIRPVGFDSVDWILLYNYPLDLLMAGSTKAGFVTNIFAMIAVVLSMLIAAFIATGVTRPITALSQAALALSKGDWVAPILKRRPLFSANPVEINRLVESFATMRTGLLHSRLELEGYNQRLEGTVADRTRELAAKNDEYREAKARLETVIAGITDGICVVSNDGHLIMTNPSAREMFGSGLAIGPEQRFDDLHLNLERLNGQPLPADALMLLRSLPGAPAVESGSLMLVHHTDRLPLSYRSAAIYNGDECVGTVTVFRDISAEFEVDRAKSEFVSVASHQLRTPLTAVRWYAEAIADGEYGALNPEVTEAIQTVCTASKRMSSLIDTLLNVARLESGRLRIAPELGDLPTLLRELMTENLPHTSAKKVALKMDITSDLPPVNFDPNLVKVVLQNLLTNAVRYTPAGGTITVSTRRDGESVVTSVADTGIGIPEHEHHKIFQKMFRGSNVSTTNTDGNGLGLYIAKTVVDQCGGRIWFETKVGVGTTFHFTLPIKGVPYHEGNRSLITKIPEV